MCVRDASRAGRRRDTADCGSASHRSCELLGSGGKTAEPRSFSRFGSQPSGLSPAEWEAVQALARGIVAKRLHDPVVPLRELSGPGNDATHARVLAELVGIEQRRQ